MKAQWLNKAFLINHFGILLKNSLLRARFCDIFTVNANSMQQVIEWQHIQ